MTYQSTVRRLTFVTAILVAIGLTLFFTAPFGKGMSLAQASAENTPATGAPRITGMLEVGQLVFIVGNASIMNIQNEDGMKDAVFSYQWIRNDGTGNTDIEYANGATYGGTMYRGTDYFLTDADAGKTIKVRVSFTDDEGNAEAVTSEASTVVAARPNTSDLDAPTSLTAERSQRGIDLRWEAPEGTVTGYQILRMESLNTSRWWEPLPYGCATSFTEVHVDDTGSDATTYTDTDVGADASYTYSVRAINSDGVGRRSRDASLTYRPSGDSGAPEAPRNLASTRANDGIELSWDAPVGEVTGYQILRWLPEQCEFGYRVYVENTNSTDTSWVDRNVVAGTLYAYLVRAINDAGFGELPYSSPASMRPAELVAGTEPNTPATGLPTISGTAQVGETLTADITGIADADGMENDEVSFYWSAYDYATGRYLLRSIDWEGTYTIEPRDVGMAISVIAIFTDDRGNTESLESAPTEPVVTWSATLTVGEDASVIPKTSGYSTYGMDGTLSTDTFTQGGTTYRVQVLAHQSGGLVLVVDQTLPADFTLSIGDAQFQRRDGSRPSTMFQDAYWWEAPDLNWSSGDLVEVSVTLAAGSDPSLPQLPLAPPTAYFRLTPETHNGVDPFTFRLHFTEAIATNPETLRDHSLNVIGGSIVTAGKVGESGRIWEITVTPDSTDEITIGLPSDRACDSEGAVCTADGRGLYNSPEFTVPGPEVASETENTPATGAPTISGIAQIGQILTVDTSGIADADGLTNVSFSYLWLADDIPVPWMDDYPRKPWPIYPPQWSDYGKVITVRVTLHRRRRQRGIVDQRGDDAGGIPPNNRPPNHQWKGPGRRDPDGRHIRTL